VSSTKNSPNVKKEAAPSKKMLAEVKKKESSKVMVAPALRKAMVKFSTNSLQRAAPGGESSTGVSKAGFRRAMTRRQSKLNNMSFRKAKI
jgi:hypothetical protein